MTNLLNLLKNSKRGTSKIFNDNVNGILYQHWKDDKVVSFTLALMLIGDGGTTQQCGKDKAEFTCLNALISQNQYMGYADLVDFDKKLGMDLQLKEELRNGTNKDFLVYWTSFK